jgi:hypothetical protein
MRVNVSLLVGACLLSLVSAPQAQTTNDSVTKSLDAMRKMLQQGQSANAPQKAGEPAAAGSRADQVDCASAAPARHSEANPDITGLRLGMTAKETGDELVKRFGSTHMVVRKANLGVAGTSDFVTAAGPERRTANNDREFIGAQFAAPPSPRQAVMIARTVAFPPGKAPNFDEVRRSLEEKYGRPTHSSGTTSPCTSMARRDKGVVPANGLDSQG